MRLIDAKELCHRLCNGFVSHDGYVEGKFVDVFKDNGITFETLANPDTPEGKMIELVIRIIESIPEVEEEEKSGVKLYIKDFGSKGEPVHEYGENRHDSIMSLDGGRTLFYLNLQNGDGSSCGDYRFVHKDGSPIEITNEIGTEYAGVE